MQVNLSILYAALSPPARIVDVDENWDTQRYHAVLRVMNALIGAGHGWWWQQMLPEFAAVRQLFAVFCAFTSSVSLRLFDRLKSELQQEQDLILPGGK